MLVWFFSLPREAVRVRPAPGIPCALFISKGACLSQNPDAIASRQRAVTLFSEAGEHALISRWVNEADFARTR
jgi:hypothetical protein